MRLKYLDYAKGFGILMIVLAHCMQYFAAMDIPNRFVRSFHVPIFFVIAGILSCVTFSHYGTIGDLIQKRSRTLLIPYIIFSIINSLLKLTVLGIQGKITKDVIISESVEFFITGNGTVWFLMTLFLTDLIYYLIRNAHNVIKIIVMVACLIVPYGLCPLFSNPINSLFVFFVRIIAALGYYLVGSFLFAIMEAKVEGSLNLLLGLVMIVAGVISFALFGSIPVIQK